ncbi:MAG: hypothetical protein KDA85_05785, partial [Planctomycetaceae bacterium]|nr:hypothetical protein [Planctomycetaceae bacterium]
VLKAISESEVELQVTVTVPDGYYVYSMKTPFGLPTVIELENAGALTPVGEWTPDHPPKVVHDDIINETMEKHIGGATWSRRFTVKKAAGELTVAGTVAGQFCSTGAGGVCINIDPPLEFSATAMLDAAATEPAASNSAGEQTQSVAAASDTKSENVGSADFTMQYASEIERQGTLTSPASFTVSLIPSMSFPNDPIELRIDVEVQEGWHTFAVDQDSDEGIGMPTEINITSLTGLEPLDPAFVPSVEPDVTHPLDDYTNREHHGRFSWVRRFTAIAPEIGVSGTVSFQLCDESVCIPPDEFQFTLGKAASADQALPSGVNESAAASEDPLQVTAADSRRGGLLPFILLAVSSGFIALLTPCVFPMIPVTVSFFLKQSEKQHSSPLGLALAYCLSIVAAFTVLGVFVSLVFGGGAVEALANNGWLNLAFSVVFLFFGLGLLGMFELRMPSWLLTWSAKRESTGGYAGVFFMAMTFTLISFTCTFAFVGQILVWSAQGEILWPIIGMLSFSLAFASPFFLLALFPSFLKQLPKSGGWMNTAKVTMGLVELGFALKFVSIADVAFSPTGAPFLLDRPAFLVSLIGLAAVTGLYLLGMFRLSHDSPSQGISPLRCLLGVAFLVFGLYVTHGTFAPQPPEGWLWGQIDAFAPTQVHLAADENVPKSEHNGLDFHLDFEQAVKQSSLEDRLLFLDFTGQNCINCRLMEKTVLSQREVHDQMASMVRGELFVDVVPGFTDPDRRREVKELNNRLQL